MSQKRTVPVTIQGREYPHPQRRRSRPRVQRAAELLDETMTKVRARSGTVDSVDVAVLTALNLAQRSSRRAAPGAAAIEGLEQRIADLAQLVETATADSSAAVS